VITARQRGASGFFVARKPADQLLSPTGSHEEEKIILNFPFELATRSTKIAKAED
jgi:hypothetical protein